MRRRRRSPHDENKKKNFFNKHKKCHKNIFATKNLLSANLKFNKIAINHAEYFANFQSVSKHHLSIF
jgi:hypothetical protein